MTIWIFLLLLLLSWSLMVWTSYNFSSLSASTAEELHSKPPQSHEQPSQPSTGDGDSEPRVLTDASNKPESMQITESTSVDESKKLASEIDEKPKKEYFRYGCRSYLLSYVRLHRQCWYHMMWWVRLVWNGGYMCWYIDDLDFGWFLLQTDSKVSERAL